MTNLRLSAGAQLIASAMIWAMVLGCFAAPDPAYAGQHVVTPVAENGGDISPNQAQLVADGGTAVFQINASTGFEIAEIGGTCPTGAWSGAAYTTGQITSNCSVIARFEQLVPGVALVRIHGSEGVLVSNDGAQVVPVGEGVSFTVSTDVNYEFATPVDVTTGIPPGAVTDCSGWTASGPDPDGLWTWTLSDVQSDCEVYIPAQLNLRIPTETCQADPFEMYLAPGSYEVIPEFPTLAGADSLLADPRVLSGPSLSDLDAWRWTLLVAGDGVGSINNARNGLDIQVIGQRLIYNLPAGSPIPFPGWCWDQDGGTSTCAHLNSQGIGEGGTWQEVVDAAPLGQFIQIEQGGVVQLFSPWLTEDGTCYPAEHPLDNRGKGVNFSLKRRASQVIDLVDAHPSDYVALDLKAKDYVLSKLRPPLGEHLALQNSSGYYHWMVTLMPEKESSLDRVAVNVNYYWAPGKVIWSSDGNDGTGRGFRVGAGTESSGEYGEYFSENQAFSYVPYFEFNVIDPNNAYLGPIARTVRFQVHPEDLTRPADWTGGVSFLLAEKAEESHQINVQVSGMGEAFPSTISEVPPGADHEILLTPAAGHFLEQVELEGGTACSGLLEGSIYTVSIAEGETGISECTVIPKFSQASTHYVTPYSSDGGTISPSSRQTVSDGQSVVFELLGDDNPTSFAPLSPQGTCPGSLSGNQWIAGPITEDCTVEVNFVATHQVVLSSSGEGVIEPSGAQTVLDGRSITVKATPNNGYRVLSTGAGAGSLCEHSELSGELLGSRNYQLTNIANDCEVSVTFVPATLAITPSGGLGGSISPASVQWVDYGATR
ncbi:hypothetical protein N9U42_04315, partial [Luminiphilus sp.]